MDRLAELAKEAGQHPEWRAYSEFAEHRSRGLRAEAFRSLERFIQAASLWSFDERLIFSRWLLEKTQSLSDRATALPQPLWVRIAVPTVREWSAREPSSADARLWLGLLGCDDSSEHLARALELDPKCDRARWTLVERLIGDVEYNQHHLPDFYIHDPRNDLPVLDQADVLIDGGSEHSEAARLRQEVSELRRRAEDWLAAHPRDGDFAAY